MSITRTFIVINTQFFGPLEGAAVSSCLNSKLQKCLYAAQSRYKTIWLSSAMPSDYLMCSTTYNT